MTTLSPIMKVFSAMRLLAITKTKAVDEVENAKIAALLTVICALTAFVKLVPTTVPRALTVVFIQRLLVAVLVPHGIHVLVQMMNARVSVSLTVPHATMAVKETTLIVLYAMALRLESEFPSPVAMSTVRTTVRTHRPKTVPFVTEP